jgi:Na+/melibiose symporter-like transporter
MLTGLVLEGSGFTPNVEQTPLARTAILGLYSLFPFVCYGIGTLLFSRFSLDEKEHQRIQAALDARAAARRG